VAREGAFQNEDPKIKTYGVCGCTVCGVNFVRKSPAAKYCGSADLKNGCQYKKHLEKNRRAFKKHYTTLHTKYRARVKEKFLHKKLGIFVNKQIPKKERCIKAPEERYLNSPEAKLKRKASSNISRGAAHANWCGDKASYSAKHDWVRRWMGAPQACAKCGKDNLKKTQYHWANISHTYKRDRTDWVRLCVRCHKLYDLGKISL